MQHVQLGINKSRLVESASLTNRIALVEGE
jgi:hypothetical protein